MRLRNRKLNVYLLDEEWELLCAKTDEAGLNSVSEYIRNMILFGATHERTNFSKADAKQIIYELNKIGTNINQIALRANTSGELDMIEFQNLYECYADLISAFHKFAKGDIARGDN